MAIGFHGVKATEVCTAAASTTEVAAVVNLMVF